MRASFFCAVSPRVTPPSTIVQGLVERSGRDVGAAVGMAQPPRRMAQSRKRRHLLFLSAMNILCCFVSFTTLFFPNMNDSRPVNQDCPYCGGPMAVSRMTCGRCDVSIDATFPMSRLGSLPVEHQKFIEMFVLSGGNLKEIAEQ